MGNHLIGSLSARHHSPSPLVSFVLLLIRTYRQQIRTPFASFLLPLLCFVPSTYQPHRHRHPPHPLLADLLHSSGLAPNSLILTAQPFQLKDLQSQSLHTSPRLVVHLDHAPLESIFASVVPALFNRTQIDQSWPFRTSSILDSAFKQPLPTPVSDYIGSSSKHKDYQSLRRNLRKRPSRFQQTIKSL